MRAHLDSLVTSLLLLHIPALAASAQPLAYVTNTNSGTVSVIDTAANTVAHTIPLPSGRFPQGIAITADNRFAYVTALGQSDTGTVVVIDLAQALSGASDAVVTTIPVGKGPDRIAIGPDGAAYVMNALWDTVSIIDTRANAVTTTVRVGFGPSAIAFTADGLYAFITIPSVGSVEVLNLQNHKPIPTVLGVGSGAHDIATSPDDVHAYVANADSANVSVLNTRRRTVTGAIAIPGGASPQDIALSPDGASAYVTCVGPSPSTAGTVAVLSLKQNLLTTTVPVGDGPEGIAVTPDGTFAYAVNSLSDSVSVIDLAADAVATTIPVGVNPLSVAIARAAPPTAQTCVGDCDQNGRVTVDELLLGIDIALGNAQLDACPELDPGGNGVVTLSELLTAVNNALNGCASAQQR
jgi:YVTN family beta-propeller protein